MSDYLARAVAFIQENGDELERARLAGLLGRERPEAKVVRVLAARQNDDGGFPYQMIAGRPSAVSATATALQWLQDLRLRDAPQTERAAAFLLITQRPGGTWEESPALIKYDPPPLLRPGHPAGRLYATVTAALWLARLLGPRHESVGRAFAPLRRAREERWPEDEPPAIAVRTVALAALVEGHDHPLTAAGLAALSALGPEAWTADRLADLLGALHAAGFAADEPPLAWGIRRLTALQRDDGGWSSEQGRDAEVDLSLRALAGLLAFGVPAASRRSEAG